MPEPVLLVDKTDGIATLTLNRPEKRNALSLELRILFQEAIEDIRTNDDISVVILTGAGKTFCAGLDLTEMGDPEFRRKENTVTDILAAGHAVLACGEIGLPNSREPVLHVAALHSSTRDWRHRRSCDNGWAGNLCMLRCSAGNTRNKIC